MSTLFEPQLQDVTETLNRDIKKWMDLPQAEMFRKHLEVQVLSFGSMAIANALKSDDEPNRVKMSEQTLIAAKRAQQMLDQWDLMRQEYFKFQTLVTR